MEKKEIHSLKYRRKWPMDGVSLIQINRGVQEIYRVTLIPFFNAA